MKEVKLNELVDTFKAGVATIIFEKVDGSERVMVCTLNPEMLPDAQEKTDEAVASKQKEGKLTALPVYDVENDGWRSFCLSRLLKLNGEFVKYVD